MKHVLFHIMLFFPQTFQAKKSHGGSGEGTGSGIVART